MPSCSSQWQCRTGASREWVFEVGHIGGSTTTWHVGVQRVVASVEPQSVVTVLAACRVGTAGSLSPAGEHRGAAAPASSKLVALASTRTRMLLLLGAGQRTQVRLAAGGVGCSSVLFARRCHSVARQVCLTLLWPRTLLLGSAIDGL